MSSPPTRRSPTSSARSTPHAPQDTLQTIVEIAARDPGRTSTTWASPSPTRAGQLQTKAATPMSSCGTGQAAVRPSRWPCVYANEAGPVVRVKHAKDDERWPRLLRRLVGRGLCSQLGTEAFEHDTVQVVELFATHAALGRVQREDRLSSAIETRQLIGQATGILVELVPKQGLRLHLRSSLSDRDRPGAGTSNPDPRAHGAHGAHRSGPRAGGSRDDDVMSCR